MSMTAASAAIIFGPTDFNSLADKSVNLVTTVTDAQLNGHNDLLIEYTVTRTEFSPGDSWATLSMNSGAKFWDFVGSDYAALTLTQSAVDESPNHETFDDGGSGSAAQVDFLSAGSPSHAVRITISGVSGELSGTDRTVKFEIDELAATFSTADITLNDTVTIAEGGSLALRLHIREKTHNVTGLTVSQAATATTTDLASSPNPSEQGQTVTFTATVKTNGVTATGVGGTIVFKDAGTPLITNNVINGVATLSTNGLAVGSHSMTAEYSGGGVYLSSTSSPATNQVVNASTKEVTTTLVASSLNPSLLGSNVTFTATVKTNGVTATSAGGTVVFKDGATPLSTEAVASGVATLETNFLIVGTHTITAEYSGDANHHDSTSAATNQVVQTATTTDLASSLNPSFARNSVTFTATVKTNGVAAAGAGGTMVFKDGGSTLSTEAVASGIATFETYGLAVGSHSMTAEYSGGGDYLSSTSSPVLNQVVQPRTSVVLSTHVLNEGSLAAATYANGYNNNGTDSTVELIRFTHDSNDSPINLAYNQALDTIDVSPWVVKDDSREASQGLKSNGYTTGGGVPAGGENLYLRDQPDVNNEGFGAHANWIITFDLDDIRTVLLGGTSAALNLTGDFGAWGGIDSTDGAAGIVQGVIYLDGVRIDSMPETIANPTADNQSFDLNIDSGRWLTFGIFNGDGTADSTLWDDALFQDAKLTVEAVSGGTIFRFR